MLEIIINKTDIFVATISELSPDVVGIAESWANDNMGDAELYAWFPVFHSRCSIL